MVRKMQRETIRHLVSSNDFVAIGFQHSVANAFIIPAAILKAAFSGEIFRNFIFVYLGNIIGGAIFVSGFYYLSYRKH